MRNKHVKIISENAIIKYDFFEKVFLTYFKKTKYYNKIKNRINWYYQQCLKIIFLETHKKYLNLIWDADTLIINKIELTGIEKVIFTSSTSVYGNQAETITEESELLGTTEAARQIIAVEKKLLEHKQFESCILRLGGLVGPNRHPIFTLSGKKNIPNPLSPINFIHQQDAVSIILHIIENWQGNQAYNAVTPFHPTRIDYYSEMAKIAALEAPAFEKSGIVRGIVSANKVRKDLNFKFLVKNLLILN